MHKNSIIEKSSNSIESSIDGEVVLLNLDNNEYYSMDQVGSDIWKILDEPHQLEEIISRLQEKYDVDRETCMKDITEFLKQLEEKKIIIVREQVQ